MSVAMGHVYESHSMEDLVQENSFLFLLLKEFCQYIVVK